jgi:CHAD domain-containing protein
MAYRFRLDESIAKAVPRIARKLAEKAVDALADPADPEEAVHEARTSIKRLRGLLRILRPHLGKLDGKETRKLRALADQLSAVRDAEVVLRTLEGLWPTIEAELGAPARRARGPLFARLRRAEASIDREARLVAALRGFRKLRDRSKGWRPKHAHKNGGWAAIAKGFARIYADGRRALGRAYTTGADEDFHEWRKLVKYHGYHLQLCADVWPEELGVRQEGLERLGDLLGEDHDLVILRDTLAAAEDTFADARDRIRLFAFVAARQAKLREEARGLGERLYAEPAPRFAARVARYWRAWRAERPPRIKKSPRRQGQQDAPRG